MKRYGLIAALCLLIAVNALVLVNVGRNRSGEYDAEVKLTERELPVNHSWRAPDKENTGLSLRLDWSVFNLQSDVKRKQRFSRYADWFDRAKLESIGFDCSRPLSGEESGIYYRKMLPRKTFVVLEYEGSAWQAWREQYEQMIEEKAEKVRRGEEKKKDLDELRTEYEVAVRTASRLFAVDAGNDAEELRRKYPDRGRTIIAPAEVSLSFGYRNEADGKPVIENLRGTINEVLVDEINVPLAKRGILEALLKREKAGEYQYRQYGYNSRQRSPYYTVIVRYGKRHEPWIADIERVAK